MSIIYLKVSIETLSKFPFSGFKKFVTNIVFGELQLTQRSFNFKTSYCNLRIRGLGAKLCVTFWKQLRRFNLKNPCIFLNENININKNKMESKMENPAHSFRETNLVLGLILESQTKYKTVMNWSARKKRENIFLYILFCPKEIILTFVFYFNV